MQGKIPRQLQDSVDRQPRQSSVQVPSPPTQVQVLVSQVCGATQVPPQSVQVVSWQVQVLVSQVWVPVQALLQLLHSQLQLPVLHV